MYDFLPVAIYSLQYKPFRGSVMEQGWIRFYWTWTYEGTYGYPNHVYFIIIFQIA